jgi:hypothetical protein
MQVQASAVAVVSWPARKIVITSLRTWSGCIRSPVSGSHADSRSSSRSPSGEPAPRSAMIRSMVPIRFASARRDFRLAGVGISPPMPNGPRKRRPPLAIAAVIPAAMPASRTGSWPIVARMMMDSASFDMSAITGTVSPRRAAPSQRSATSSAAVAMVETKR